MVEPFPHCQPHLLKFQTLKYFSNLDIFPPIFKSCSNLENFWDFAHTALHTAHRTHLVAVEGANLEDNLLLEVKRQGGASHEEDEVIPLANLLPGRLELDIEPASQCHSITTSQCHTVCHSVAHSVSQPELGT